MRKFLYLLLALPLLGLFTSCDNDDKDAPNVSLSIDYKGATEVDGVLNVVQGDTLKITSLNVEPAAGTKEAMLINVVYTIDDIAFTTVPQAPFAANIYTEDLSVGAHYLTVRATVLQTDKTIGYIIARFNFNVTPAETVEPGGGDESGDNTDSSTLTLVTKITDHEQ